MEILLLLISVTLKLIINLELGKDIKDIKSHEWY